MRTVLHLIDTTGPGGAETIFSQLACRLDPARFRSVPVVGGPGWVLDSLEAGGQHSDVIAPSGALDLSYIAALRRSMRRHRANIVQCHLIGSAVYGSIAARLAGARAVATFHGHADLPQGDRLRAVRFRILNQCAARVVFVSESLRQVFLGATSLRPALTTVIPNGVDLSGFHPGNGADMRSSLGIAPDELVIGAVGNVRTPKAYEDLLRAVSGLSVPDRKWRLVIVGDTAGDAYPPLEVLRAELGLGDRVIFTGFRTDVGALLRAFDLFVLSSRTEGFSLSTVQAMATGLPVLATRSGGPEEIVRDGVDGILVPTAEPAALAAGISRLASDPDLSRRLGVAAATSARKRFDVETMLKAYQALYDEL